MDCIHWLRRHRLWLVFVSLAVCLPGLTLAGSGHCPLLAASRALPTPRTPGDAPGRPCCPLCAASADHAHASSSDRAPAPQMVCCEAFRAYLPLGCKATEPGGPESQRFPADGLDPGVCFLPVSGYPRASIDGLLLARSRWRVPPPGTFACRVSRRCFPPHAPPLVSDARLS